MTSSRPKNYDNKFDGKIATKKPSLNLEVLYLILLLPSITEIKKKQIFFFTHFHINNVENYKCPPCGT